MSLRVTGSYYLGELLPPETETQSGIALADSAQAESFDAWVVAAGPGRVLNSGARYPMQAGEGDRIVVRRNHWRTVDERERLGFVADEDLVAVLRAPEFTLTPASDYVLVSPDPPQQVSAGGIVLVRSDTLGGEARLQQRAEELCDALYRLSETETFREQPTYYQHRMIWDFLDGVSSEEYVALGKELERRGKGQRESLYDSLRPFYWRERATSGTLVSVGPGPVNKAGRRSYFSNECYTLRPEFSMEVDITPASCARVHWSHAHAGVSLCDGERTYYAIPSKYLLAVETEW